MSVIIWLMSLNLNFKVLGKLLGLNILFLIPYGIMFNFIPTYIIHTK